MTAKTPISDKIANSARLSLVQRAAAEAERKHLAADCAQFVPRAGKRNVYCDNCRSVLLIWGGDDE